MSPLPIDQHPPPPQISAAPQAATVSQQTSTSLLPVPIVDGLSSTSLRYQTVNNQLQGVSAIQQQTPGVPLPFANIPPPGITFICYPQ